MIILGGYDGSFVPQQCPKDVPTVDLCTEQQFTSVTTNNNKILEYNHDNEEWLEIGTMREGRWTHWVSVVQFEVYGNWCSYE